jgi:hypothetical protein
MTRTALKLGLGLTVILAAVAFATPAFSDDDGPRLGVIVGRVHADRTAVADAHVRLLDERQNVVARTVTGERGQFRFHRIRPGRYLVVAQKRDVGAGRAPVAVTPRSVTRVRIELAP